MENVLEKLSEVECMAEQLMTDTAAKKRRLTEEMEQARKVFDQELAAETADSLAKIRTKLEEEKLAELASLRETTQAQIRSMSICYEQKKDQMVETLFQKILDY